jgi:hypothetical protein
MVFALVFALPTKVALRATRTPHHCPAIVKLAIANTSHAPLRRVRYCGPFM